MWTVSPRFLEAIPVPHRLETTVTVTPPGGTATPLGFYGGTVTVSGGSLTRRTATLAVQGGSAVYDLLSTPGAVVRVMHGIKFTTSGSELVPVITGELSAAAQNVGDALISIDVADYWQKIDAAGFATAYTPPTTASRVAEISARVTAAVPAAIVTNTSDDTGKVGTTQTWESRSDFIKQFATDGGSEVFFTPDGNFTIRDEAQVTDAPVWAVKPGTGGNLKTLHRTRPLDKLYNRVIVTPASLDGAQQWPAQTVAITDTASPRHQSKIGIRPYRWESTSAMTAAEAATTASILLARNLGNTERLQLGTLSNPALEAGDVITVVNLVDGGTQTVNHLIDGFSLDLTAGDMTIDTRSSTDTV